MVWDPRGRGLVRLWPTLPPLALRQPGAPTAKDLERVKAFERAFREAEARLKARASP
jgi:hypothetical protein